MDLINTDFIKKIKFQRKIDDAYSQCLTCERKCRIAVGESGYCQTRINSDGEIYTIVYGLIPALSFNPIEKKPLFHFYPGSVAITVGTYGCNFSCFWCQNHHISHPDQSITDLVNKSREQISPQKLIEIALKNNCQGTSISFNEPTILFEYSLEVFKLAKNHGLYNTYVTNGFMTEEVLKSLADYGLDAMNIDIKGSADMVRNYCGVDVEKVWRNAKMAVELGIHVEITTLLIENYNTNNLIVKKISERISKELGEYTPFHITRFFPQYNSHEYGVFEPTPINSLYKAYDLAKETGLKYVYLGNLSHTKFEDTYCPNCSKMVIKRTSFGLIEKALDSKGNCIYCGFLICKQ